MIALAVAAAMPVAAQADATLSGNVEATYKDSAYSVDADVTLSVTEVLTNGMTASAELDLLDGADGADASVSLAGDFGSITAGDGIAVNAGADAGDVAGLLTAADASDGDPAVGDGLSYSGSFAGVTLGVATTSNSDYDNSSNSAIFGGTSNEGMTSIGAAYDFNGVSVGYASMKADSGTSVTAIGAKYTVGDLSVYGGEANEKTVVGADYAMNVDALAITANVEDIDGTSTWEVNATYTLGAISVGVEKENGKEVDLTASYSAGALSITYDEGETNEELIIGYDMGNADFEITRDTTADKTQVQYKVSF